MSYLPIKTYCTQGKIDQLTCARYCISFGCSIVITLISGTFCFKTYINTYRLTYELIPMGLCCIQGIIHIFQFSIINENHLTLLANALQIITFSIVGYAFSLVYKRIISNENILKLTKKNHLTISQLIHIILFGIQFIGIMFTKSNSCNVFFTICIITTILNVVVTTISIIFYGNKLKKSLSIISERFSLKKQAQSLSIQQSLAEQSLPQEKIYQIKLVVYSTTVNTILYLIIVIVLYFIDNDLLCDFQDNDLLNEQKNITLLVFVITQLFPCFIVPYAFNYQKAQVSQSDGLDFQYQRTFSTKSQNFEVDEQFVQRLTVGRANE